MKALLFSIAVVGLLLGGAPKALAHQDDYFTVDVYFSSADEDVNAFGSTLSLPASWTVDDLILKDSDLIYWIEAPQKTIQQEMSFSGIFPGGVQNLKNYSTPLLLFSLNVHGDFEYVEDLLFTDAEIFLNHPMALAAENSLFLYKIRSAQEAPALTDISALDDLIYSFTNDPVSGGNSLVLNSYRGALAAYTFEMKEGDFWSGDWSRINGVSALNAQTSTVSLFVTAPDGGQETLVLRRSIARTGSMASGILLCLGFVVYLFRLSLRVLRFDPLALPKRPSHSMARSRETTNVK